MTLIALHTDKKRARIMTDTWGYSFDCTMSVTSKHTVIPHLDMAVAAQGSTGFHSLWLGRSLALARQVATFDEFTSASPDALRAAWAEMTSYVAAENAAEGARATIGKSVIFHVGYSAERDSFTAFAHASEQDFQPIDLTDTPYIQPTPLDVRPGPVEGPRLRRHFEANGLSTEPLDALEQGPLLAAPRNRTEWVELAKKVRVDRGEADLWSGFRTFVGGDVHLTTLVQGASETKRIHHYADDTASLRKVFAGTMHPMAQNGPCVCDSGRSYIDCCLGEGHNGRPCPCGSPYQFEDCCSVLAGNAVPVH